MTTGGSTSRHDRWPADAATRIEAAAAAFELCDTADFETVLMSSLAEVASLFGIAALGECTGTPGEGVTWFDESSTNLDELIAMIGVLEQSATIAEGPYSVIAPSGRPAIGVPNPPGSFAHYFAVLAQTSDGFTAEQTSLLGLFAATVSSARRRVVATRLLEERLQNQEFLNDISAVAASESPESLRQIAIAAKEHYGVGAVSMWRFDGGDARLTMSSEPEADSAVGDLTVPISVPKLDALVAEGALVTSVEAFSGSQSFRFRDSAELLIVPMIGAHGAEGTLTFTDPRRRTWTDVEIAGAQSIARSMQKVIDRGRAADVVGASIDAERMLREIAGKTGAASFEAETDVLDFALASVIDHFDLTGATIWHLNEAGDGYRLVLGRFASGERSVHADDVPVDFDIAELDRDGYVVVDHGGPCDAAPHTPVSAEMIVALNEQQPGGAILSLGAHPDRVWSATEINAARTLGSLLHHAMARFDAERRMHRQLELESLARRAAYWAVDARTDTVDAVLDRILREVTDFFDLSETQIWRVDGDSIALRRSYRVDGVKVAIGFSVPFDRGLAVERRGWSVFRLADIQTLWDGEIVDPPDTRILVTAYADADEMLGMLMLVDPSQRHWDDDEIAAIQSIGDTIGQLRTRLEFSRELDRQRAGRDLLNDSAAEFVNATLDTQFEVIEPTLERIRTYLDCHSVALFVLNRGTLDLECPVEATVDGEPLQQLYAPMRRDDPVIARLLDPAAGPAWNFGELIGLPAGADRSDMLVFPSVRGRDILIVSAVQRFGASFPDGAEATMRALAGLLAQLRSRMELERAALTRSESDRLLGEIAADFVERSVEDVNEGVFHALERVAALFGLRTATLWQGADVTDITPTVTWSRARYPSHVRARARLEPPNRLVELLRSAPDEVHIFEPGAAGPDPSVAHHTVMFAPVVDNGRMIGGLSSTDERPIHLVPDLETQRDLLEALAHLVRQLWRRLEADAEIGRKLASEDLLRQFATRLVSGDQNTDGEEALGWLARQFGIDHASMWRVSVEDLAVVAEPRVVYGTTAHLRLPDGFESLRFTVDREWTPGLLGAGTDFPFDLDRPGVRDLRRVLELEGPRRCGFVAESDGAQLFFTRPGGEPIPEHVIATMSTALSILSQHAAKSVAERAFASAFSAAPIAICMRDRDTNLISCNSAYAELTGRSEGDLAGTPLAVVLSPEQVDEILAETTSAELGSEIHRETAYRRPDGSIVWARVRTTSVVVPGRADPVFFTYSEDITESRRARQLLEYQATHDELTGLPNRRAFVGAVSEELSYDRDCAVLILDLDRFKLVNDSLGHSAGDMLLITCADRIRLSVRPGDTVCRLGGDEFAILLRSPADNGAAAAVADRLLRLLAEPVRIGDEEVFPSASIGIAIPEADDAVEDLLRHADAAMYQAKAQGRDRAVRFDRSMRDAVVERIRTETDLRRAIENGQLEVHYQPEFVLDSGQIVGAEALLRWHHPERGLLAAGAFIALVEETGLVVDVGRWVLGQATMQAASWVREGHDIIIRVNLSARQLRSAIVGEVKQALSAAALAPERLCLELTETAIMDDVQESARILQEFRDLGVQVAIDDFGTGFSSLAYLKRFPVDILKIDRTFVDGVGVDPDDTAIVRSVIGLARTLRLEVVAEGIEDPTQIAELVRLGCNRGQGFHLARPAPPADIAMLLAGSPE